MTEELLHAPPQQLEGTQGYYRAADRPTGGGAVVVALRLQSPKPDVVISSFYITHRQIARVNARVCVHV